VSYPNPISTYHRKDDRSRSASAILMELVMEQLTAGQVEICTGGFLASGSGRDTFSGISIDTRTLHSGDLYFAIRGPNNDGHKFIPSALDKGAAGVVVDYRYSLPPDFPEDRILLRVDDTHRALKEVAADVRRQWQGTVIGITGSMGKTTTKEFVAQILQADHNVYRSPGNYNNLFGLPLAIFGLTPADEIGIFEMAMSEAGEIAEMCLIAQPDIGVITNVAPVHLEFFDSIEDIAQAKAELAGGLPQSGILIYNADDHRVRHIAGRFPGRKISFGLSAGAQIRAESIRTGELQETRFAIKYSGEAREAMIPLAGRHNVLNALPAFALGLHFGMEPDQILEGFRFLRQTHMRGQIICFREGFKVIDDSYNSNPRALTQMVQTVAAVQSCSRRVMVAGEMLELGRDSEALHYRCGEEAAHAGIDVVVGVRGAAREIVRGAREAGIEETQVHFFTEIDPATDFVSRLVKPGDLVLIKGSRGVHLDKMVRVIRSHYTELSD